MKHTKGPWIADITAFNKTGIIVGPNGGEALCQISNFTGKPREENVANARLMASAPEMLEALLLAQDFCDDLPLNVKRAFDHALKKARGNLSKKS